MWEWFSNQGLRTFCHLRDERSFDFGNELHSLICHRCSGIYSAFLIFFCVGFIFRYRGHFWKGIQPTGMLITGVILLFLSPLQVFIQKSSENPLLTGGSARFIIGSLTGLGLLHLYYGLDENKQEPKGQPWMIVVFAFTLALHVFISHLSAYWINLFSMFGLLFVYILMNRLVINSTWSKSPTWLRLALIPTFIGLEWSLLFWNNVLRHQHG